MALPDLQGANNPYRPPMADDEEPAGTGAIGSAFYAVSSRKLLILYLGTMGVYSLYWFYQHFSQQRRAHGSKISPVGRAIFGVFYVHGLFRAMDTAARRQGITPSFNPSSTALMYVGLAVVGAVLGMLQADQPRAPLSLLSTVLGLLACIPLERAQQVANAALGDPTGSSNDSFGGPAIVALSLGALLWAFSILELFGAV